MALPNRWQKASNGNLLRQGRSIVHTRNRSDFVARGLLISCLFLLTTIKEGNNFLPEVVVDAVPGGVQFSTSNLHLLEA